MTIGGGILGVSLAFGFSVITFAYAFGNVTGAHLNPAISFANFCAGRMDFLEFISYLCFQVLGAIGASMLLYFIVNDTTLETSGFATNGYGANSPGNYSMSVVFVTEFVMTFMFSLLALGVSAKKSLHNFAPLSIGLSLALIHVVTIPISNTSVNPARSTGPALIHQGTSLEQLWLFWVAPMFGALLAGVIYRLFLKKTMD